MAARCIFDEDEVCIPTSTGGFKYGLVVESSECVSSDDDDDDDESRVQRGQVKIAWHPSGTETVVAEDKVILSNRSLMPGDVVRRLITGEQSQRGYVQSVHTKCHVQVLGSKQYIYNVDAADIKPMQEFDPEPEVTLDSWVGQIIEVVEEITVRFPCGARCKLENAGSLNLEDIHDKREAHSEFSIRNFYPGQELAGCYDDYQDATWLYTSNVRGPKSKIKHLYNASVVVEEVKTHSITVDWACKGFTRAGAGTDKLESPPECVQGEDLLRVRRLDCFEYCHSQIGDKGYYIVKDNDVVLHNISPRKHITPDVVELQANDNVTVIGTSAGGIIVEQKSVSKRKVKSANKQETSDTDNVTNKEAVETEEKKDGGDVADDEFQDVEDDESDSGSDTASLPSGAGSPAPNRKVRKRPCLSGYGIRRMRGKKARKKVQHERDVKPGLRVPVEIAYTFSSCDVMWQNGVVESNVASPELFPIHHLDELEFFPGDFVLDDKKNTSTEYGVIVSSDHKERTVMVKWVQPYAPGKSNKPLEQEPVELSVFDIKDHPDYKFRCGCTVIRVGGYEGDTDVEAVGQVYSIDGDGVISVWWPDRTITSCYPQDLYIIGDEFRSESGSESDEWTDVEEEEEEEASDVSWETENEETDEGESESTPNKVKPMPVVSDDKQKELSALLVRAQTAIWGLLIVFENFSVPYFKNSEQVFHDILAIFKRCKEFDKVLKSSFFDDEEIASLISNIKDELRKERTGKLSRHVVNIYKNRTACVDPVSENTAECVEPVAETCKPVEDNPEEMAGAIGAVSGVTDSEMKGAIGAVGGVTESKPACAELSEQKRALVDKITNTDDPLLQIILDTLIAQEHMIECYNSGTKKPDSSSIPSAKGDFFSSMDNMKEHFVKDFMQSVVKTVCDTSGEVKLAFDSNGKVESVRSSRGEVDTSRDQTHLTEVESDTKSTRGDQTHVNKVENDNQSTAALDDINVEMCEDMNPTACEDMKPPVCDDKVKTDEQPKLDNGAVEKIENSEEQSEDKIMHPNHRTLCIRVCKALNVRVMQIKQEIARKWLAKELGCADTVSDIELFEKMQAKMIESVESGNGPLRLSSNAKENVSCMIGDVIRVNGENVLGAECIKELESLEERKDPFESETEDQTMTDESENNATTTDAATAAAAAVVIEVKGFEVCSETPSSHKFQCTKVPSNPKSFMNAVRKEWMLLRTSLPDGIFVKVFEDRMDLMSVMIMGPLETPYEDGLFVFDIQLPPDYPNSPPTFFYHSFCNERLNPNLYEDGKVCVSLLGTWSGKGNECWTNKSSVLQVLVSIQGLILVPEPYFNEAGYEKQRGSQHGQENSRMYNEMAVLKLVQSMAKMSVTPPSLFVEETRIHIRHHAHRFVDRVEHWVELSDRSRLVPDENGESSPTVCNGNQLEYTETSQISEPVYSNNNVNDSEPVNTFTVTTDSTKADIRKSDKKKNSLDPEFPLLPASKGFCLTVKKHLNCLKEVLAEHIFINSESQKS